MFCSTDQVAQVVLPDDVFQFTIINADIDNPYVILVWVFTTMGDQEATRVDLEPLRDTGIYTSHCTVV